MNLIRVKSQTASNHACAQRIMRLLRQAFLSCVCVCVCVSAKGVVKTNLSQSQHSNPPPPVTTMLFEQRKLPPAEKICGWRGGCLVPMEPNKQLPEYTRKHNTHEPASLSSEVTVLSL